MTWADTGALTFREASALDEYLNDRNKAAAVSRRAAGERVG